MSLAEAEKKIDECMKVLYYRDARSLNKVLHEPYLSYRSVLHVNSLGCIHILIRRQAGTNFFMHFRSPESLE